jgi:cytoskeletal protein CcmA (bactofilin family)
MPPNNDQEPTSPETKASSLEDDQKTEAASNDPVATAAESLDQAPNSLDSNSEDQPNPKQSIFSTIQTPDINEEEKRPNRFLLLFKRLDKYILIFVLVLIVVVFIIFYIIEKNKNVAPVTVKNQPLSQTTLSQLNANSVAIGGSQETLDIQSNSVFSGSALVKGELQVAGPLTVSGNTTLQNAAISGTTQLNQVAGNSLTIDGTTTLKGQLVVGQSLTVAGNSTLSGSVNAGKLTVSSLQVNGNISVDYHLVTNGLSPTIKATSSLGSGGTTSINGTDTAGTIAINFGSGVSGNLCESVSFNQGFATIPSVIISPSNSGASDNTNYYVTQKSDTGFEICLTVPNDPNADFDYFVID